MINSSAFLLLTAFLAGIAVGFAAAWLIARRTLRRHVATPGSPPARVDAVTGLPDRASLDERLAQYLAGPRLPIAGLSLILADVDHFKEINDAHGHLAGDAMLATIGRVLQSSLREADFVARFGGDEFAVVLPDIQLAHAVQVAERLRCAVERASADYQGRSLQATISCGVAQVQPDDDPRSLLQRADAALYAAKQSGRNATWWHNGTAAVAADQSPAR